MSNNQIIFVTGTDTGAGKTVLTALLLAHLRGQGRDALGMKPFCSGDRGDARLLHSLQEGCLTLDEVNPFYFDKPLAPAAAPKRVPFQVALGRIRALADRCGVLLIEGAGGLLAPLGDDYTARDLIAALKCKTMVVSRNRLGTINHTLLSIEALRGRHMRLHGLIFVGDDNPDNMRTIADFSGVRILGLVPRLDRVDRDALLSVFARGFRREDFA